MLPTESAIAASIDHAVLRPESTRAEVGDELDVAAAWHVFSVCVRPNDVDFAVDRLRGSGVAVGTVIGFPHGDASTAAKVAETRAAVDAGASEVDVVLAIGLLRSGLDTAVTDDIRAVVDAAGGRVTKVILETSLLDDTEIVRGCACAVAAGAHFVKTSTGFGGGGATVADVRRMRDAVPSAVEVKASGGVRSLDTALDMLDAGATRLGTSATATILGELRARRDGVAPSSVSDDASY